MPSMRTIGHYRLLRQIGHGGMGVVYEAVDERLGRRVAVKLLADGRDDAARRRMLREAQVAAQVSHPKVCRLLDLFQDDGNFALVMEFLQGESLGDRLARGPLPWSEAEPVFRDVLDALAALHHDDIIHRDLKPSNVFLTARGAKLLDFGVASIRRQEEDVSTVMSLKTMSGTAHYLAPEQMRGEPMTTLADLFSAAVMFYQALTGAPPFIGRTMPELMYALLNRDPAPFGGSPDLDRAWTWLRKALAKNPQDRYSSAEEMLAAMDGHTMTAEASHAVRRLVVMPFRLTRVPADLEFLAFSLADAVGNALAGLDSLSVRSTHQGSRVSGTGAQALARLAKELDVDTVLTGILEASGDQLRLEAQLLEAPGGGVVWSAAFSGTKADLFGLQSRLTEAMVLGLRLPLTAREKVRLAQDRPANGAAYEHYLRGNVCDTSIAGDSRAEAKFRYRQCLHEDPSYAPAWARLGRLLYIEGKFHSLETAPMAEAEECLHRAFSLNADLPLAHQYYTSLEVDSGRAVKALGRLVRRGRSARGDAALFAGLGHALRYCGLLPLSLAAYQRATQIDPTVKGAGWTVFHMGRYSQLMEMGADSYLVAWKFWHAGDRGLALTVAKEEVETNSWGRAVGFLLRAQCHYMSGELDALRQTLYESEALPIRDPEFWFFAARLAALAGEADWMFRVLEVTVRGGFWCAWQLRNDPAFAPYRADPRMHQLATECETRSRQSFDLFRQLDGLKLLVVEANGAAH